MKPILTTQEAADLLKIKTQLIRRWCRDGYLPAVKLGRSYRISRAALISWWEEKGGGELRFEDFYQEPLKEVEPQKAEPKAKENPEKDDKGPKEKPESIRKIVRR